MALGAAASSLSAPSYAKSSGYVPQPTPFYQKPQAPIPGVSAPKPTPLQTAAGAYQAAAMPDLLQLQLSNNAYTRGLGYAYQGQGLDAGGMNLDYQSQLGDVNTQIGQNAVDLAAANRQIPYLNKMQELGQQLLGLQAGKDTRSLNSQATAQGAFVSSGANDQRKDIYANLVNALGQSETQYDERRASAMDSAKKLQLEASNLGLKPGQLKAQLDNGLAKLGLKTAMSVDDLMDGLAKNDLTAKKIYATIIANAQQYVGATG